MPVNHLRSRLVDEFRLDGAQQGRLIVFDRQEVVATLVGDLTGKTPLASHRVDADQQAMNIKRFQEFEDGGDLIALAGHLFLAENNAQFRREGANQMNRTLAATARPAHRFAVDRHDASQGAHHSSHPAPERGLKLFRIQCLEEAQEGLLRGNTIPEYQKFTQPRLLRAAPLRHVFDGVAVGEHRGNGDHKNLQEIMPRPVTRLPRIGHFTQTTYQACPLRLGHPLRPNDESRPDFLRAHQDHGIRP